MISVDVFFPFKNPTWQPISQKKHSSLLERFAAMGLSATTALWSRKKLTTNIRWGILPCPQDAGLLERQMEIYVLKTWCHNGGWRLPWGTFQSRSQKSVNYWIPFRATEVYWSVMTIVCLNALWWFLQLVKVHIIDAGRYWNVTP